MEQPIQLKTKRSPGRKEEKNQIKNFFKKLADQEKEKKQKLDIEETPESSKQIENLYNKSVKKSGEIQKRLEATKKKRMATAADKEEKRKSVQISLSHITKTTQKKLVKKHLEKSAEVEKELVDRRKELAKVSQQILFTSKCKHEDRFCNVLLNGSYAVECIYCSRLRTSSPTDWDTYIVAQKKRNLNP